jgi:hypothetical protein
MTIEDKTNNNQAEDMEMFIRGARMAYEDCANWMEHLAANLPAPVSFCDQTFYQVAETFRKKIGLMEQFVKNRTMN